MRSCWPAISPRPFSSPRLASFSHSCLEPGMRLSHGWKSRERRYRKRDPPLELGRQTCSWCTRPTHSLPPEPSSCSPTVQSTTPGGSKLRSSGRLRSCRPRMPAASPSCESSRFCGAPPPLATPPSQLSSRPSSTRPGSTGSSMANSRHVSKALEGGARVPSQGSSRGTESSHGHTCTRPSTSAVGIHLTLMPSTNWVDGISVHAPSPSYSQPW
mmetsp:Transcript_32701/g.91575  ORF Transcript_32701/g.91575 Transcript_32701/m.91575 type:complete len:214 (-) Transcript_32701:798-1439(-)